MSAEASLITSLKRAVATSPDDLALRRHLASLLLEAGRPADVLEYCLDELDNASQSNEGVFVLKIL